MASTISRILSQLRFPLPVSLGGTGKTSMGAGAVGTVSQAAGIATGAILQSVTTVVGSQTNSYTKYADGRLICTSVINYNGLGTTVAWGSLFIGGLAAAQDYPVPFITVPAVTQTFQSNGVSLMASPLLSTATQWGGCYPVGAYSTGGSTYTAELHRTAIGRWY
jgi:hypothetical protein